VFWSFIVTLLSTAKPAGSVPGGAIPWGARELPHSILITRCGAEFFCHLAYPLSDPLLAGSFRTPDRGRIQRLIYVSSYGGLPMVMARSGRALDFKTQKLTQLPISTSVY